MPRFFVSGTPSSDGLLTITGEDVKHIKKVLRLEKGEEITVCDGRGNDYLSVIEQISPDSVDVKVMEVRKNKAEPDFKLVLLQGLPKSDKMEAIIQKCVELGVDCFYPVTTERTVVRLGSLRDARKKNERWQRIALEAAKQCGRGRVPEVKMPISFNEALDIAAHSDLAIIPYENEETTGIGRLVKDISAKSASVLIGPEGGFAEEEVRKAVEAGIRPVTLGPRILRTETAGPAAAAILLYELGDLGSQGRRPQTRPGEAEVNKGRKTEHT